MSDDKGLLSEMREQYADDYEAFEENIKLAMDDIKFRNGEQWPSEIKRERETSRRPCLTFNKLDQYVDQPIGAQRKARPQIKIAVAEGALSRKMHNIDGSKTYDDVDIFAGLVRYIEYASRASQAYDTAFEHAIGNGFGHIRVLTQYVDDDVFEQEARIAKVGNPLSVLYDRNAEEYTREDAQHAFITSSMDATTFKRLYPGAVITGFEYSEQSWTRRWLNSKEIVVAERYDKVPYTKTLVWMSNGAVYEYDEKFRSVIDELARAGISVIKDRKVKSHKIRWHKFSGADVLEGPVEYNWKYIPLVPVWGKELCVNGKYIYRSNIRHAKDAMRQYNFARTAAVEFVALAPMSNWVVGASQIGNFANIWETANVQRHAYLPFDDSTNPNHPQRIGGPQIPAAFAELVAQANEDIKGTTGKYDPSLGNRAKEASGRALMALQSQADDVDYQFPDNMSRSVEHVGRILVTDTIPSLYDTERIIQIMGDDGATDSIRINTEIVDEQTGQKVVLNDMTTGKFKVSVTTGPSFASRRIEAAAGMMQFINALAGPYPQAVQVMAHKVAENMDWPQADQVAKLLKKILPPGISEEPGIDNQPLPDGANPPAGQPPVPPEAMPPEIIALHQGEIEAQTRELAARLHEAQARIAKAEADIAKAQSNQITTVEQVREIVAETLAGFIAQQAGHGP